MTKLQAPIAVAPLAYIALRHDTQRNPSADVKNAAAVADEVVPVLPQHAAI